MNKLSQLVSVVFLTTVIATLGNVAPALGQIRLSFGGNSAPTGWFDETVTDTLFLLLDLMVGPPNPDGSNSIWYLNVYSNSHELHGFPDLEDTDPFYKCVSTCDAGCYYQMPIWLRSRSNGGGSLLVGASYTEDEGIILEGLSWDGGEPTDFTDILFAITSHTSEPLESCSRGITIPIVWVLRPVPVEQTTWGRVKSRFE